MDKTESKYVYIVKQDKYTYDIVLICHDTRKAANSWVRWAKKHCPEDVYKVAKYPLYSE